MSAAAAAALAIVAAAVAEILVPGQALYHAGWFNVLLLALVAVCFISARGAYRRAQPASTRAAVLAIAAAAAIAGVAATTSGLFAPDNQTLIGAPGQRLRVESLGVLVFPLASAESAEQSVTLERPLHAAVTIGARRREAGNFILRTVSRSVVFVEARDLRGNRLTVTQPSGTAFLSPVLLMEHRQTIAGLDVPYDSFNVPAMRRVVKAILFTPAQAAMMLHGTQPGESAVLFAVDDEKERPLPHAIALSAGGRAAGAGGLSLRGSVETYPAVEVVAAPNLLATIAAALLAIGGIVASIQRPATIARTFLRTILPWETSIPLGRST
ncbi:MAG TPA: hypothetical protein VFE16_11585 [Candidatus Cybelea sp.]|nr:hypothetical protein [Candidatus Cybelea sp.]